MTLIRWEPTRELSSLQSDVNRLFNAFFDPPTGNGASMRRWIPAMDLVETEDHFILRADLPGLTEQDVSIDLEDTVLTVSGERKVERATGAFSRSLTLPEGVDADAIQASFADGMLEIRIPKPEQRKPRKVAISVDNDEPKAIEGQETDG